MLRRLSLFLTALLCAALLFAAPVSASPIGVRSIALESTDEGYVANADFDVELTPRIEEALHNGVSLYFVVEFELIRPRWYWFDEKTVASRLQYRLTYHALTRQYRLWTGTLHQPFASLAEARRVLGRVRSWVVLDRDQVAAGQTYQVGVRMRLDASQLPKPFQLTALTNPEWTLESEWKRFAFMPVAPVSRRLDDGANR